MIDCKALRIAGVLVLTVLFAALSTGSAVAKDEPASLKLTFLGNEGVLLESGEHAVLIDALSGDGLRHYVPLTKAPRILLESAQPPFDNVDLALATHYHQDHFDAAAVSRFLRASPATRWVSTEQAADALRPSKTFVSIRDRVAAHYPKPGERVALEAPEVPPGMGVQIFPLSHRDTQNLGIIVELGGMKVLHVGDTNANAAELARYALTEDAIDVALLPYWLIQSTSRREAIRKTIAPKHVVAIHVPLESAPANYFGESRSLKQLYLDLESVWPGIILMREPMETRVITAASSPAAGRETN